MTITKYTYSISTDTLNNKVNLGILQDQIQKSGIAIALHEIIATLDILNIYFKDVLSGADAVDLTTIVNNHEGEDSPLALIDVHISEEDPQRPTGGHYVAEGLTHIIPAGQGESYTDFVFPYPIAAMDMKFSPTSIMEGDTLNVSLAPDTTIGAIISDVTAGDSTFSVSPTVITNIKLGFQVYLDDGTNKDYCGRVSNIDKLNSTITVSETATHSFSVKSPTYLKISILLVSNLFIQGSGYMIDLGSEKIGGSYIPANTIIRFIYTNNEGSAKSFSGVLGMLY